MAGAQAPVSTRPKVGGPGWIAPIEVDMFIAANERLASQLDYPPLVPLALSVVIPTMNERDNVGRLVERLAIALAGVEWEAIFVDDGSTDGTVDAVMRLARTDRRVRLISRFGRRGLSSAVIEGMLSSTAPVVAVIDADLQHDERILPQLFRAVEGGECDLAVGSRYAAGGSIGDWSASRARISLSATRLAELITKTPLSDPMSGFFALRHSALFAAAPYLTGTGYKILLDVVASSRVPLRVVEIPYCFKPRSAGTSKLDLRVALQFLELLVDKLIGRWVPMRFVLFALVGTMGLGVHLAMLAFFLKAAALPFSAAMTLATLSAMTFNFVLNNFLTYRDRRLSGVRFIYGLLSFYLVCSVGAAANVGVGELIYGWQSWWLAGAAGAAIGSVWNFAVGGIVTWRTRG